MNQVLSTDDIMQLTRRVVALCARDKDSCETFGEWVLSKFYPGIDRYSLVNAHELVGARRTVDARMYLSAQLAKGRLNPEPLQRAVQATEFSELELLRVI